MQIDFFSDISDAPVDASPPVVEGRSAWRMPENVLLDAALCRGSLRDATKLLGSLKVKAARAVLLRAGFEVEPFTSHKNLFMAVQGDLIEAAQRRITGQQLAALRAGQLRDVGQGGAASGSVVVGKGEEFGPGQRESIDAVLVQSVESLGNNGENDVRELDAGGTLSGASPVGGGQFGLDGRGDRQPLDDGLAQGDPGLDFGGQISQFAGSATGEGAGRVGQRGEPGASGQARDFGDGGDLAVAAVPNLSEVGEDFVISDGDQIGVGSLKKKFNDNIAAIELLRVLDAEKRRAVGDERLVLARYVGWGGLKGVFDPKNRTWGKDHQRLRQLISEAEWQAASRSQLDAFYTPTIVAKAMFDGVQRLGFGSGRILEPSVGVGNFFGLMPEAMRRGSALHGVELDLLTSKIAEALYPSAHFAKGTGFEAYQVPAGYFDLVIGNPPFGAQATVDDRGSAYSGWSIHNYFFAKSIMMLAPGGLMSMVVSHNFLDKLDPHVRQWIARRAELVSGVRLPNTAFQDNANTEVVTDVLIFRRLTDEQALGWQETPDWLSTGQLQIENEATGESHSVVINNYFINNKDKVLGVSSTRSSQFRANDYTVTSNGDLAEQLATWVSSLPEGIYRPLVRSAQEADLAVASISDDVKEGCYFVSGATVMRRLPDALGEHRAQPWMAPNSRALARMKGMIAVRDALRRQINVERSSAGDDEVERGRRALNRLYTGFRDEFGFINDPTNRRIFLEDTDSALIEALEFDYEKALTKSKADELGVPERPARATPADILLRRVLFPPGEMKVMTSAKDALLHCLNLRGHVDMDYIEQAYNQPATTILAELGELVYEDPVVGLVTADHYLSGDVKTKLDEARVAASTNFRFAANVAALEKVIPASKLPSQIHAPLGASWIPTAVFNDFLHEVSGAHASVTYIAATAQWLKHNGGVVDVVKNNALFGTKKMGALDLVLTLMNSRVPEVKKTVTIDGVDRQVTDEVATEAVRACSDKLRAHWDSWLWGDGERSQELAAIYNDRFNRTVNRKFDGQHLTFPGMNPLMKLLPHQMNGVWRGLQDRSVLFDHVVGAGKTYEIIALLMEMRRLGIAKKPFIGVPNHLTLQWRSEFLRLYPGANVLAATPQDFEKINRERFFAKIATGNWDAVIVGHSSIKKIAVPIEAETKILKEQFDDMVQAIATLKEARGDKNVLRDMEKIRIGLENKIKKLQDKIGDRDKVVDFADLGVDAICIDEFHIGKNLGFSTQMTRVAGLGNPAGSGLAFDWFVKIRWLKELYGENAPLITATGTPISNSLAEMFTMQRYMQYTELKKNGLHLFDAWARQYGDVQAVYEVAPSGTGYRLAQRFASFKNLPSLMGMYRSFADCISLNDLKAQEIARGRVFPVPQMEGGGPINVVVNRSDDQERFFGIPELVRNDDGSIRFGFDLSWPFTIDEETAGKFIVVQEINGHSVKSKACDSFDAAQEMVVLGAITPVTMVDPDSIVGKFERVAELTRSTNGKVNALSLTGAAIKGGLDYRLIDPAAADFAGSKINVAVTNLLAVAAEWEADRGVQLIFCDLSVPLSAKANMAKNELRVYVRDSEGALTHDKGTLHTAKGHEDLPYYLVPSGSGKGRTFDVYDALTGSLIVGGLDSKHDANLKIADFLGLDDNRLRWDALRGSNGVILDDEIAEYKIQHELGGDIHANHSDVEITREDIGGVVGEPGGFSVYDDMRAKLIAGGVPASDIEFIHDHGTPLAKEALFKRVNSGDVRFLFGSTQKMGAGTNVQQRAVALHHVDAPWRPSDLTQREGRVLRRGNRLYDRDPEGFRVKIYRYATASTYDTRRWQILEHKAKGAEQISAYDGVDELEDIASEAANAGDMKAAASGNPLILKETELANEVKRLRLLERAHRDADFDVGSRLRSDSDYVQRIGPDYLEKLAAFALAVKEADNSATVGFLGSAVLQDKDQVLAALERVSGLRENDAGARLVYRGLTFVFNRFGGEGRFDMRMPDKNTALIDVFSPRGILTRMDNWCAKISEQQIAISREIAIRTLRIVELKGLFGKEFELSGLLAQSIEKHGKVQRQLMRDNSVAAVRAEDEAQFQSEVTAQKNRLKEVGLGAALALVDQGDVETSVIIESDKVSGAELVKAGLFVGEVLAVDGSQIRQRLSRSGDVVTHDDASLAKTVTVGDVVEIRYQAGVAMIGTSKECGQMML